jgi:two-component system, NtrC family, response regulator AtoC
VLKGSTILIADDEPYICELFRDLLEPEEAQVLSVHNGSDALSVLEEQAAKLDLAILDVRMPAPDGLAMLKHINDHGLDVPVIILTALDSSTVTIEAMQLGAYDYVAKPFDPDNVLHLVERAIEYRRLTRRVHALEQLSSSADPRDTLIGRSAAMQRVYKLIGRIADSNATVLITGESGTGKEVVARTLHRSSPRRTKPFVAVNCAALPETLLESELFGHEKGAFTGAMARRKGRFEQATEGIIFLDEIGEMSQATQKKLLRVLQDYTFERVGGNITITADVRVIAATNRNLEQAVADGLFREDLYYRLNVISIHLPPLRERKDDIPLLVQHFLSKKSSSGDEPARICKDALTHLMEYHWPGNIRQLENTIERAVVLAQNKVIGTEHLHLPDEEQDEQDDFLSTALAHLLRQGKSLDAILGEVRIRSTMLALQQARGNRLAAAHMLGIPEEDL